jgi:hypothetical protein
LRNLYTAAPDLHIAFTRGRQIACVHIVVAQRRASEPVRPSGRCTIGTAFVGSVLACLAAPRLDARLATAGDPLSDVVLARYSRLLISARSRRTLARGLEHAWSMPPERAVLSAAAALDDHAVKVPRPVLQRLAAALRSRADVESRRVPIAQLLLTEPSSDLYRPAYCEEFHERARAALFTLRSRAGAGPERLRR